MSSNHFSPSPRASLTPILKWAGGTIVLMAVLTFAITALLGVASGQSLIGDPEWPELLKAATPAAALIAASAAGAVGFLRQRSQEDSHNLDLARHEADLVTRLRERYSASAEQLGHDSVAVRLAGVYALAALADDWIARGNRSEAQVCIDLLCAYQRVPRRFTPADPENRAELEVRQTITRVITDHLRNLGAPDSWSGLDFDFTGATFDGECDFSKAQFTGTVNFSKAQFTGTVNFSKAQFTGTVHFDYAQFTGDTVSFCDTLFGGVYVEFYKAVFSSHTTDFVGAIFAADHVNFGDAKFAGQRVTFGAAKFSKGVVDFIDTTFNADAYFIGATFGGTEVAFNTAIFNGGADFSDAKFTGGKVDFHMTSFAEDQVDFEGATVTIALPGLHFENLPKMWKPDLSDIVNRAKNKTATDQDSTS